MTEDTQNAGLPEFLLKVPASQLEVGRYLIPSNYNIILLSYPQQYCITEKEWERQA
jgi:hypothetical protein